MANKVLRRSPDKQIAGVCAGIAEYLEADVQHVRLATIVLAVFTSAPVLVLYFVLAFVLPVRPAGPNAGLLKASWQQDGLRVSWMAPVAAGLTWPRWLAWSFAVAAGVALFGSVGLTVLSGGYGTLDPSVLVPALLGSLATGFSMAWPLALFGAMLGMVARPYAVTVTHAAVWVEMPLAKARRIDLEAVEDLHIGEDGLTLHLRDGELIRMPALPDDEDGILEVLRDQVLRSHRRALDHQEDLAAADDRRQDLERVLAGRRTSE